MLALLALSGIKLTPQTEKDERERERTVVSEEGHEGGRERESNRIRLHILEFFMRSKTQRFKNTRMPSQCEQN